MTILYVLAGVGVVLVLMLVVAPLLMMSRMRKQEGKAAPELDGAAGDRVRSGAPALFYFFSPQCGACKPMTPVVKDLAGKSDGVFPVDVSRDLGTARKFGIMATPSTIVVQEGIVRQILIGPQPRNVLEQLVA